MYTKRYKEWIEKVTDVTLQKELKAIDGNGVEIENKFYKDLEFGTGGLRGVLGVGTNCLNIHTIEKATQGVANYILKTDGNSVAISCDSRINSDVFSKLAASILAASGVKVYLTKELMPTPFLSFITREYACNTGIMITASHNPKKYNGYKVYGSDGCQITDNAAEIISSEIAKVEYFSVKYDSFDSYVKCGMIEYVADSVIEKYMQYILTCRINKTENLSVTYTPLNGTGYKLVPQMFERIGIDDVKIVKEQGMPDGNFPTCEFPNPEKKEALALGLKLAKESASDILIATDPDADRVGIAIRHNGEYVLISGNEVGVLLCEYILSCKKAANKMPKNPLVVKTIVSTRLADKICKEYGVAVKNVLTGFKYIGEQIGLLEAKGEADSFVLGFEESYGYLVGTSVRDKDAVVACMMICEMTSFYKKQGKTLVDVLGVLYEKYGKYEHKLFSYQFEGASGSAKILSIMKEWRENPLPEIAGYKVLSSKDYFKDNGDGLPKANVLVFDLDGGSEIIFRPSGTEPLIKIYLTVSKTAKENAEILKNITNFLNEYMS